MKCVYFTTQNSVQETFYAERDLLQFAERPHTTLPTTIIDLLGLAYSLK